MASIGNKRIGPVPIGQPRKKAAPESVLNGLRERESFALIELLVIIATIGFLALVVLPTMI